MVKKMESRVNPCGWANDFLVCFEEQGAGFNIMQGVPPGRCTIGLDHQPNGGPTAEVEVKPGIVYAGELG